MRVGFTIPQMGPVARASDIQALALAAEDMGASSLWAADHLVLPVDSRSDYPFDDRGEFPLPPDAAFLELFSCLSYLAGITSWIGLGSSVCVGPYRPAALLVKTCATLDVLAPGRTTLGLGAGWLKEEFDALGRPFNERGKYLDEILEVFDLAWGAEQPVVYAGDSARIESAFLAPRPPDSSVRIIVGGGDPGLRRAKQFGLGWHPHVKKLAPESIEEKVAEGTVAGTPITLYFPVEILDSSAPDPLAPWQSAVAAGDADQVARLMARYWSAGVEEFVVTMRGRAATDTSEKIARMRELLAAIRRQGFDVVGKGA